MSCSKDKEVDYVAKNDQEITDYVKIIITAQKNKFRFVCCYQ
jgi:hypothetical protein